jgi:hypothetical protein
LEIRDWGLDIGRTWIAEEVRDAPPANDAEWMRLLEHYAALARLKRANVPLTLPDAVVTAKSAEEAKARVCQQLALLPDEKRNESITALIQKMETLQHSTAKFYPRTTQITRIEKIRGDSRDSRIIDRVPCYRAYTTAPKTVAARISNTG